jgi:hypothetical protein
MRDVAVAEIGLRRPGVVSLVGERILCGWVLLANLAARPAGIGA